MQALSFSPAQTSSQAGWTFRFNFLESQVRLSTMVSAVDIAKRALVSTLKRLATLYAVACMVTPDSSDAAVRTAYRKLPTKTYSDHGGALCHILRGVWKQGGAGVVSRQLQSASSTHPSAKFFSLQTLQRSESSSNACDGRRLAYPPEG